MPILEADWLIMLKDYIEMEYRPMNVQPLLDEKDLELGAEPQGDPAEKHDEHENEVQESK
jgi:hypothetical protein